MRSDASLFLYHFFLNGSHKPLHKWHHYFPIYERHFSRLRERKLTVLEIGVQRGGSLQMWKAYFPNVMHIHGIDIDPACGQHQEPRVSVHCGDSADKEFLQEVLKLTGPLDLVIDDGGHTATQQINAFEALYPAVVHDGIYLVEDTSTSLWPGFTDTPDGKSFLQFAHEKTIELYQWTGDAANFSRFFASPAQREGELDVSEFCRSTGSIHFYDGIIVFEKSRRTEPWHQVTGNQE